MEPTTTHTGSHLAIPDTASPGLVFLKHFLPVLDSLEVNSETSLALTAVLAPGATFTVNGGPPQTTEQILPMLLMRAQKLAAFGHNVSQAWDIPSANSGGGRTLMYEGTSSTVFKEDPEGLEVKVAEFNIVELVPVGQAEGGLAGFRAAELRTFMDAAPVTERAAMIFKQ